MHKERKVTSHISSTGIAIKVHIKCRKNYLSTTPSNTKALLKEHFIEHSCLPSQRSRLISLIFKITFTRKQCWPKIPSKVFNTGSGRWGINNINNEENHYYTGDGNYEWGWKEKGLVKPKMLCT